MLISFKVFLIVLTINLVEISAQDDYDCPGCPAKIDPKNKEVIKLVKQVISMRSQKTVLKLLKIITGTFQDVPDGTKFDINFIAGNAETTDHCFASFVYRPLSKKKLVIYEFSCES